jgi:Fe-Mn family superoxide dismutase
MRDESRWVMMNRRQFLITSLAGSLVAATNMLRFPGPVYAASGFDLPQLPYPQDALAPHISERQIGFHYGKHHRAYIEKLNELLKGTKLEKARLEDVIKTSAGFPDMVGLFNNAAQAWNHTFYWKCMRPGGGGKPISKLAKMIQASFGNFNNFREEFTKAAATLFGSGWAWLVENGGGLEVVQTSNADNPLIYGQKPLLTIDVWEHAYYLDYQNARKDYIAAFLDHLINWEFVAKNLSKA